MSRSSNCHIHPGIKPVTFCPACRGGIRTKPKAAASRENGKLGGRPAKNTKKASA